MESAPLTISTPRLSMVAFVSNNHRHDTLPSMVTHGDLDAGADSLIGDLVLDISFGESSDLVATERDHLIT
jgi:hypothetical protein